VHRVQHVRDGCPAKVIEIEAGFDPDDPAHPKYPVRFEIDYSRCIFCGLCVEACPEDAIRMVKEVPEPPDARSRRALAVASRAAQLESAARRGEALSREGQCGQHRGTGMIETVLLWLFAGTALAAACLMLVLRHPMRVALALTATMLSLAGVYALLGVHVIAVFQVLIYVGAVMVFMVYAIMLLDVRDRSFTRRFSRLLVPGIAVALLFLAILGGGLWRALGGHATRPRYVVHPAGVLGGVPERLLAALRARFGAARRGGGGGTGRARSGTKSPWITYRCSSPYPQRCSRWDSWASSSGATCSSC
jgi:NADH:ubiquinone oxidoreductase subunit 6 (subunit J)/NAD-dependent dihydropyrimidine dehydrogenase PreA subunit